MLVDKYRQSGCGWKVPQRASQEEHVEDKVKRDAPKVEECRECTPWLL